MALRIALSHLITWRGLLGVAVGFGFLGACRPDADLAPAVPAYAPTVPTNLPQTVPAPARNPLSRAGVALGRTLFYDVRLSGGNRIACATCHQPDRAFSDGLALSAAGGVGPAAAAPRAGAAKPGVGRRAVLGRRRGRFRVARVRASHPPR